MIVAFPDYCSGCVEETMRSILVLGVVLACVFCFSAASPAMAAPLPQQAAEDDVAKLTSDCKQKNLESCATLGEKYSRAAGVTRDYAKAVRLFQQSCDGGSAKGCHLLAGMHYSGAGVPADKGKATTLYQKSCEGGYGPACSSLAYQYDAGSGLPKDWDRATELFKKACAAGYASACSYYVGPNVQTGCTVPENGFMNLYRALNAYDVVGDKAISTVEDALMKSDKSVAGCEQYHYLWAQVYALKRDWTKMEASYRSGMALGGRDGHSFARSVGDSMMRAASPDGTEKMIAKLHTLTPPVPAELQRWFEGLVQAGLERWKDDKDILKLRERIPKS